MAQAGLFIGWGDPTIGREAKGLEVFAETLAYFGKAEQDGRIESHETVLLYPHGGDLGGSSSPWERGTNRRAARGGPVRAVVTRATLVVQNVGVVDAALGDGLQDAISVYQAAVTDLT